MTRVIEMQRTSSSTSSMSTMSSMEDIEMIDAPSLPLDGYPSPTLEVENDFYKHEEDSKMNITSSTAHAATIDNTFQHQTQTQTDAKATLNSDRALHEDANNMRSQTRITIQYGRDGPSIICDESTIQSIWVKRASSLWKFKTRESKASSTYERTRGQVS